MSAASPVPHPPSRSVWSAPIDACVTLFSRRGMARQDTGRLARAGRWLAMIVLMLGAIGLSMLLLDEPAIRAQLPRGAPELWWVRLYSELGQSEYIVPILGFVFGAFLIAAAMAKSPMTRGMLDAMTARVAYVLLAVALSVLAAEILKDAVGRARPFVGGDANAFLFSPFAGTPAYESFPSGHAVAAFSLAFAVSALCPRLAIPFALYAILMAISRVVLLAHHPSDVIGGALVAFIGAVLVRSWFARRRLAFYIDQSGVIKAMAGPSWARFKRVAGNLFSQ